MAKLKAIYRNTKTDNLFWLTSMDADFRNDISPGIFEFFSNGKVKRKSQQIAPNGFLCVIIEAENGKKYRKYEDCSLSEI